MSPLTQAYLAAGVLLVGAVAIAWRTRRAGRTSAARRTPVVWMRRAGSRLAHAIREVDLDGAPLEVDSVGFCGLWRLSGLELVTEVQLDDDEADIERCAVCRREVAALERGT